MKKALFTIALVIIVFALQAIDPVAPANISLAKNRVPLAFIENKGQITDQNYQSRTDIQFSVRAASGLNIFIGNGAIHYQFSKADSTTEAIKASAQSNAKPVKNLAPSIYTLYRMDVELMNANTNAPVITEEKQAYYENYFTDRTGGKGVTAYTYNRITYKNIYPKIDWVLYMNNGLLEHEFIIHEGGKASDIQLKYGGAENLKVNTDGSLTASTQQGIITEQAPKSYQPNGNPVKSGFKLTGDILTYQTDNYDGALVIDPTLQWATYYGGRGEDVARAVNADNAGNVYITGVTESLTGIVTTGAYLTTGDSINGDIFLAKFSSADTIEWATYYGGASIDEATGVTIDSSGNVAIAGFTDSQTGIATSGAYHTSPTTGFNAFAAKFNSSGILLWGTYYGGVGGAGGDQAQGVATDGEGSVYITGNTSSVSGIVVSSSYQTTYGGGTYDAFLAKFDSTGAIQWSTYFGGSADDDAYAIAADHYGNVYITGATASQSGIAWAGGYSYQRTFNSTGNTYDAFLAKFNSTGHIQWSTYYAGRDNNDFEENGVATDDSGNVYITGQTNSTTGVATPGVYQDTLSGNNAFLAKFNSAGALQWGTYYGQSNDVGQAVATDTFGNVYITGITGSSIGIATPNAYQTTLNGNHNAFLAKFDITGNLQYGTYYGGSSNTFGYGVATDNARNVYIAGVTYSTSGIASQGAYQAIFGGTNDAFLAKFSFCDVPVVNKITGNVSVCSGAVITLSDSTSDGNWASSNSSITAINATSGLLTGINAGIDTITYSISNVCGTTKAIFPVTVNALPSVPVITHTGSTTFCTGDSVRLTSGTATTYRWSDGATTQSIEPRQGGGYTVTITNANNCSASSTAITVTVNALPAPVITPAAVTLCNGHDTTLTASGASIYMWSNAGTNSTTLIAATTTTTYIVTATDNNGCSATASRLVTVNALPAAAITGPNQICANLSATLTATGGVIYGWSNGLGANAQVSVQPTNTTTYIVTVTNANNCSATAQQTVSVTNAPAASILGPTEDCSGSGITLTANGGNSYSWAGGLGSNAAVNVSPANSTTYTVTVTIGANCSATASQIVTVYQLGASNFSQSICAGNSYNFNNQNITQSGAYYDTLQTIHSCDSIVMLNLTVNNAVQTSIRDTTCKGTAYLFNGHTLSQTGIYKDTLQAASTCDSIVTLNLFIDSVIAPTITRNGNNLQTQTFASYQWLLNGAAINGGVGQNLIVSEGGNYSVVVTGTNGCTDTSVVLNVTGLGISDIIDSYGVNLFPNPNNGNFILVFTDDITRGVEITDAVGRTVVADFKVSKQQNFNLNELAAGVYFIRIKQQGSEKSLKFSLVR